jgi:hypothetical protein
LDTRNKEDLVSITYQEENYEKHRYYRGNGSDKKPFLD